MDFIYFCNEIYDIMILIADSGSTKTDWVLIKDKHEEPDFYYTQGMNPVYMSEQDIIRVVNDELLPQLPPLDSLEKVYFYGAGCREDMIAKMHCAFTQAFQIDSKQIEIQSDMMAAARALCGKREGIACILGTGSNSCLYDGERIVQNISPMGFILGDEGSGAVLGKCFLNLLYKGSKTKALLEEFSNETQLNMTHIINKVYREPLPNRFLASLAPFIHQHLDVDEVRQMVIDNFRLFFVRNIQHYHSPHLKVNALGSISFYFEDCLREAARMEGFEIGEICKSPMNGLIKYHQNNN